MFAKETLVDDGTIKLIESTYKSGFIEIGIYRKRVPTLPSLAEWDGPWAVVHRSPLDPPRVWHWGNGTGKPRRCNGRKAAIAEALDHVRAQRTKLPHSVLPR